MMDTLLWTVDSLTKGCAYADELLVIADGNSRFEMERNGTEMMNIVSELGNEEVLPAQAKKEELFAELLEERERIISLLIVLVNRRV